MYLFKGVSLSSRCLGYDASFDCGSGTLTFHMHVTFLGNQIIDNEQINILIYLVFEDMPYMLVTKELLPQLLMKHFETWSKQQMY